MSPKIDKLFKTNGALDEKRVKSPRNLRIKWKARKDLTKNGPSLNLNSRIFVPF